MDDNSGTQSSITIRPYNPFKEQFATDVWGKERPIDQEVTVQLEYGIASTETQTVNLAYTVANRVKLTAPSIEDIYACSTYRFLALGCSDGPVFPFYTGTEEV
jgi:hypothetical protein